MAFFALKPCNFGGLAFRIGEKVPNGLVVPCRVRWFIENGYLAEMPEIDNPETVISEVAESEIVEREAAEKPRKNGKK